MGNLFSLVALSVVHIVLICILPKKVVPLSRRKVNNLMLTSTNRHISLHSPFHYLLFLVLGLGSCSFMQKQRDSRDIVAEYDGKTITRLEINALTMGMNAEDSARAAEQYIRQWAIDLIEYDRAKDVPNKDIERLVEDYRHSLYVHEYEERLIAQRMDKNVTDSVVVQFYNTHSQYFTLQETILRGVLLVVQNGAPNMDKLRKWLLAPADETNIEDIEKYAYQYATGYELFLDEWKPANQILMRMPLTQDDLQKQLRLHRQVEVQDSTHTYLLQVTDIYHTGEPMPVEYARPEIEKILLNRRQVAFIETERETLYRQALRDRKLKRN